MSTAVDKRTDENQPGQVSQQAPHPLLKALFDNWEEPKYQVPSQQSKDVALEFGDEGHSLEEVRFLQTTRPSQFDDEDELVQFKDTLEQFEEVLMPLGGFLKRFNEQLANLSKELESLKTKATALSSNLDRERELEQKYSPMVGDLAIPPEVVREIYNGEVNKSWCEVLNVIEDKRLIYEKYTEEHHMELVAPLKQLLEALNKKALERIKMFVVSKIKKLRVVGTPSQVVQSELLGAKEAFNYLQKQEPSLALELKQAYIYTMRWYYKAYFHRYVSSLAKLHLQLYEKSALIGGVQSYFHTQQTEYTIGKRSSIVTAEDPTVMPAQIAEHNPAKSCVEVGFRSFNLALCDNASVEFLFMSEFFGENVNALLEQILDPTYQLGSAYTKSLITNSYDIFGVLIMIRLSQSLIFELQKRRIPAVEDYLNLQMILLWPRFQQLVDANCENLKRAASKSSAITMISTSAPHPLTIQFTNLIYGFHQLTHKETQTTQEPLSQSIQRLRNDYEQVMTKLSKNTKQAELFLYTNYAHVLSVLTECESSTERDHFQVLVSAFEPS